MATMTAAATRAIRRITTHRQDRRTLKVKGLIGNRIMVARGSEVLVMIVEGYERGNGK